MNLGELRTEVRFNVKRNADGFSNALIDQRLIWAQEAVAKAKTWEEMRKTYSFTLTVSTTRANATYTFPDRMKDIYSLTVESGSGDKLTYWNPRRFDTAFPLPSLQGSADPVRYVDYGTSFMLHPFPGTANMAILRCSIMPTPMVVGTDAGESELNNKDKLLTSLATSFCFDSLQEDTLAEHWVKKAASEFQASVAMDHNASDWIPQGRDDVATFNASTGVGLGYNQPHFG